MLVPRTSYKLGSSVPPPAFHARATTQEKMFELVLLATETINGEVAFNDRVYARYRKRCNAFHDKNYELVKEVRELRDENLNLTEQIIKAEDDRQTAVFEKEEIVRDKMNLLREKISFQTRAMEAASREDGTGFNPQTLHVQIATLHVEIRQQADMLRVASETIRLQQEEMARKDQTIFGLEETVAAMSAIYQNNTQVEGIVNTDEEVGVEEIKEEIKEETNEKTRMQETIANQEAIIAIQQSDLGQMSEDMATLVNALEKLEFVAEEVSKNLFKVRDSFVINQRKRSTKAALREKRVSEELQTQKKEHAIVVDSLKKELSSVTLAMQKLIDSDYAEQTALKMQNKALAKEVQSLKDSSKVMAKKNTPSPAPDSERHSDIAVLKEKNKKLHMDLQASNNENAKLKQEVTKLKKQKEEAQEALEFHKAAQKDASLLKKENNQLKEALTQKTNELSNLQNEVEGNKEMFRVSAEEVISGKKMIEEAREELQKKSDLMDRELSSMDATRGHLRRACERIHSNHAELVKLRSDNKRLTAKIVTLDRKISIISKGASKEAGSNEAGSKDIDSKEEGYKIIVHNPTTNEFELHTSYK